MIPWLPPGAPFPPVAAALRDPNGLLAAGGRLDVDTLLRAYRSGIFPWYAHDDPILWWSPDPRMVLDPSCVHVSHSLIKTLRNASYEVHADTAFADVIDNCADLRRDDGTWINPAIRSVYLELHDQGYAHSIEVWNEDNLVGGLYGLAIGRIFFGESMFHVQRDASKVALVHLCRQLQRWGFGLIDCQMETSHLASMGAVPIPRDAFIARLAELVDCGLAPGKWRLDNELLT
jgi:leucyl/phenylalanyl-tRNA--protein transferase